MGIVIVEVTIVRIKEYKMLKTALDLHLINSININYFHLSMA